MGVISKAEELYCVALGATAMSLICTSLGIPAVQALAWLKTGEWYELPLSKTLAFVGLSLPQFEWLGIQKIANYTLELPTALCVFLSATGLWCAGGILHGQIWKRS
jgi:hypothetical protein